MLLALLLQAQALGPEACILSGLCAAPDAGSPIPSGVMFTAVGLVGLGVWTWRRRNRAVPLPRWTDVPERAPTPAALLDGRA